MKVAQSHWEAGDTDRLKPQLSSSGAKEQGVSTAPHPSVTVNNCPQGWECLNSPVLLPEQIQL